MPSDQLHSIAEGFRNTVSADIDWCLRLVAENSEVLGVHRNVPEPPLLQTRLGACITVNCNGSSVYSATSDLSISGLHQAFHCALTLARKLRPSQLITQSPGMAPPVSGKYRSAVSHPWHTRPLAEKYDYLREINTLLKISPSIVDWSASLAYRYIDSLICGPEPLVRQKFEFIVPSMTVVANQGADTQTRTYGYDRPAQAGLEYLEAIGFKQAATRTANEALVLLSARECPTTECDVLLMPGQMMLQIHESIGHPLELDRILGDERNYAGTSFISTDMFGHFQYGSELLNVVFDPGVAGELAAYAHDDTGMPAQREYLIRDGMLIRPLGGSLSQQRIQLAGVANTRSSGWNRPPIDRMANINMEPGKHSLDDMIAGIDFGILMDTNRSWSIDDSRNKFQFGCEYGQLIEHGRLGDIVKNPNYRGISSRFWHSLKAVGSSDTFSVHGVLTCGKGEPNQALFAGHAAPACVFTDVTVFGGE